MFFLYFYYKSGKLRFHAVKGLCFFGFFPGVSPACARFFVVSDTFWMSEIVSAWGDASALRACSYSIAFCKMYSRNAADRHPPCFLIVGPSRPAAARVVAPPIRMECGQTRAGSRWKRFANFFKWVRKKAGVRSHCMCGI